MLYVLSSLTASLAGLAIGGCAIVTAYYCKVWRTSSNGMRLLPAHVIAISVSYAMLAVIAVVRLSEIPSYTEVRVWWTYPFIAAAFLLGNVSLGMILLFLRQRNKRVRS